MSGPYDRIAELSFPSQAEMGTGLGGAEGAALMADGERLQQAFGNKLEVLIVEQD